MTMREQFEARFPVPAGVAWSEEHQNYGWIKKKAFQQTITYRALWTGWQESRAALEVELPDTVANTGTLTSNAVLSYKRECRVAIEAAGVRVKP